MSTPRSGCSPPFTSAFSNDLVYQFNYAADPDHVTIDLTSAHIWDASSVAALDAIETKYSQQDRRDHRVEHAQREDA